MNSLVVLSDSGTLSEESAMLGFCGVLIRTSTERPEVLDKGTVVIGGITQKRVEQAAVERLTVSFRVTDTRERLRLLKQFLVSNGYQYE